eukprot:CAMPEP_0202979612 /NCGR_PEP_ID=MMETSP1396-20130829/85711_1 /ASSEMBLY_ACC=CAM_ASM_000872 /TAXON_ID= /ORGANISM="Pseudokeronopsis sp., Strain Brazil" /LENGTH=77 /DNA_ID=CAMNT_0049719107 /DNA_START=1322 /DNA_END=1554 /DNA_ORIENTATION=-
MYGHISSGSGAILTDGNQIQTPHKDSRQEQLVDRDTWQFGAYDGVGESVGGEAAADAKVERAVEDAGGDGEAEADQD